MNLGKNKFVLSSNKAVRIWFRVFQNLKNNFFVEQISTIASAVCKLEQK